MKVCKYLLQVIVLLGLISCSSEESDFVNEITSVDGQFTVAFDLSNETTSTKSLGPSADEAQINTCALFICTGQGDDARIIKKGFFKATSSCTLNFAPATSSSFYVYAVVNVSEQSLSRIDEGQTVAALKQVVTSISNNGATVTNLPKMGGKIFNIDKQKISEVQNMGEIEVEQLLSSLQLQVKTDFGGSDDVTFVVTGLSWSSFSASGRIGGSNDFINEELFVSENKTENFYSSSEFNSVGLELYTFPNISSKAKLHIAGYISHNGQKVGNEISHDIPIGGNTLLQNTKYIIKLMVNASLSRPTEISLMYEVVSMQDIPVDVPTFD